MHASSGGLALVLLLSSVLLADDQEQSSGSPAPGSQVRGRLVDEAGRPVADAVVESLNDGEQASARTDDSGHFVLDLPRKPSQVLLLRALDDGGAHQAFAGYLLDKNARFRWDAEPGLPEDLKLVLRPARQISVAVVGGGDAGGLRPVADAHVFINATSLLKLVEAQTDRDGKATMLVPADAPLSSIVAMKSGVGFDYFYYQDPDNPKRDRHRIPHDSIKQVEFVLNGARSTTVQVIDYSGQPMPGVRVVPNFIQKPSKGGKAESNLLKAGVLSLFGITDIEVTTGDDGKATFDFLPTDSIRPVSFQAMARGYAPAFGATAGAAGAGADVVIALPRVFTLRGQVSFSDGRPAAGARVHVGWQPFEDPFDKRGRWRGNRGNNGSTTQDTDARGVFTAPVSPSHLYRFSASLDRQWAAPLAALVVGAEAPKDDVRIVLEPTTRVYGRLTAGLAKEPASGQNLGIFRRVEVAGRDLSDGSWASTGETGEFEIFLPSGKYQITYDNQPLTEVKLAGEPEHEVNLHVERKSFEEFSGRVVMGQKQRGVADAIVTACYVAETAARSGIETTTDAEGAFHFNRRTHAMLVCARSDDDLLAGIEQVAVGTRAVVVTLRLAASVHGRLVDGATGKAMADVNISYGVPLPDSSNHEVCGGSVRTDSEGEFTIAGLVPGWEFKLWGPNGRFLKSITPEDSGTIELGDLTSPSGRGRN